MKEEHRQIIFNKCQPGEQNGCSTRPPFKWKLGRLLSYGITKQGFPFIVWESKNFGSILVGKTADNIEPQSKIRNDANASIMLNTSDQRMWTAEKMSKEIVY